MTLCADAAESCAVTINVPLSPTDDWLADVHATVVVATSSSVMVAVCTVVVPSVAFVGAPIVRMTVSLGSSNVSAVMVIVAVPVVAPAAIVMGLAVIVRSAAKALPVTVNGTETLCADAAESCAVTVNVPLSPTDDWLADVHATLGVEAPLVTVITTSSVTAPKPSFALRRKVYAPATVIVAVVSTTDGLAIVTGAGPETRVQVVVNGSLFASLTVPSSVAMTLGVVGAADL